jgi:uncharacterized RDD family membrane protein YckC
MHPQQMTCGSCGASTSREHRFEHPDESEGYTLGGENLDLFEEHPRGNGTSAARVGPASFSPRREAAERAIVKPEGAHAFFSRALALFIDLVLLALMQPILFAAASIAARLGAALAGGDIDAAGIADRLASAGDLALFAGYFIGLHATTGQTLGKSLLGLRVVRLDGGPLGVPASALRMAGYVLSAIPLGFGFWLAAFPPRRALHDYLGGSIVVRTGAAVEDELHEVTA